MGGVWSYAGQWISLSWNSRIGRVRLDLVVWLEVHVTRRADDTSGVWPCDYPR
jgi:hypothetical protein